MRFHAAAEPSRQPAADFANITVSGRVQMRVSYGSRVQRGSLKRIARWLACAMLALAMRPANAVADGIARLTGNHPAEAAAIGAAANLAPGRTLHMQVTLALRNQAALSRLLENLQDPSSPEYHRWLTPDQFAARFGPTAGDVRAVTNWLQHSGFTVDPATSARRSIAFHATVATAARAFGVTIAASADGKSFANLDDPAVPAAIAPLIAAIHGLSNTLHAAPGANFTPGAAVAVSPAARIGGATAFGPDDLWTFYDYTALHDGGIDGTGTDCIALIEDSDFDDASVAAFDTTFGLPAPQVTRVFADGSNPGINSDELETLLDVQYAHVAAPGAPLVVYIGNDAASGDNGIPDAIARAVSDNACGAIGVSFGFCGAAPSFYTSTLNQLFAQAATQGQGVFAATGDEGAAGITLNKEMTACTAAKKRTASELAANPNVTAVGGTQFTPDFDGAGNDLGSATEMVWHDGKIVPKSSRGAGGGGKSALFLKPAFQSGTTPNDKRRDIPDVALGASPYLPGYFIGFGGSVRCCVGGTSLGTPYWAGIAQLAAQYADESRIGNLNARLYALGALRNPAASGLRDVRKGSNAFNGVAGFRAKKFYDRSTGWGTPDISVLVPALAGP
jgi:subtilase family serine protease